MYVAIIWTDLAESNIPLDSSWRELKEGGGGGTFHWDGGVRVPFV